MVRRQIGQVDKGIEHCLHTATCLQGMNKIFFSSEKQILQSIDD